MGPRALDNPAPSPAVVAAWRCEPIGERVLASLNLLRCFLVSRAGRPRHISRLSKPLTLCALCLSHNNKSEFTTGPAEVDSTALQKALTGVPRSICLRTAFKQHCSQGSAAESAGDLAIGVLVQQLGMSWHTGFTAASISN